MVDIFSVASVVTLKLTQDDLAHSVARLGFQMLFGYFSASSNRFGVFSEFKKIFSFSSRLFC
jgi:hypothetical protein